MGKRKGNDDEAHSEELEDRPSKRSGVQDEGFLLGQPQHHTPPLPGLQLHFGQTYNDGETHQSDGQYPLSRGVGSALLMMPGATGHLLPMTHNVEEKDGDDEVPMITIEGMDDKPDVHHEHQHGLPTGGPAMGSEFGVHSTELGSYGGGEDSSMAYAHVAAVQEPEEGEEAKPKVVVPAQHKWGESSADFKSGKFSKKESEDILKAIQDYAQEHDIPIERLCNENCHKGDLRGAWLAIASKIPNRTVQSIYRHGIRKLHPFKRGVWSEAEIHRLMELVQDHGNKWKKIQSELGRSADACRDKYREYFPSASWHSKDIVAQYRSQKPGIYGSSPTFPPSLYTVKPMSLDDSSAPLELNAAPLEGAMSGIGVDANGGEGGADGERSELSMMEVMGGGGDGVDGLEGLQMGDLDPSEGPQLQDQQEQQALADFLDDSSSGGKKKKGKSGKPLKRWAEEEEKKLIDVIRTHLKLPEGTDPLTFPHKAISWVHVAQGMAPRSRLHCFNKWQNIREKLERAKAEQPNGPQSHEEDLKLVEQVIALDAEDESDVVWSRLPLRNPLQRWNKLKKMVAPDLSFLEKLREIRDRLIRKVSTLKAQAPPVEVNLEATEGLPVVSMGLPTQTLSGLPLSNAPNAEDQAVLQEIVSLPGVVHLPPAMSVDSLGF